MSLDFINVMCKVVIYKKEFTQLYSVKPLFFMKGNNYFIS